MNDRDKAQELADMVLATERLSRPWKLAFVFSNVLWTVFTLALIILGCAR